ncbi:MAG: SGNH/GDSL hydrolase family protein [Firmicutes bacterium]|nr:SGNH/GDSL hydrolase family protein [Bacillota bacterium]MCM1402103.1 SGNH/GDSL hydrolase family protein [Bacteroides sp.]MCM1478012.1 SGNH/GDSL hydrolase family protein [Bacteroides sp.]
MKKRFLLSVAVLMSLWLGASGQSYDWAKLNRYAKANEQLQASGEAEGKTVLIGNSITDFWPNLRPEFFAENDLIGRGIGGQTSYQFLVRFREDVVNLRPETVVINVATNDIAENNYPYDESRTMGNIMTMVEVAEANGIKVILTSVLPADEFPWRKEIKDAAGKVKSLNRAIELYAKIKGIPYVDYYSVMVNPETGGMRDGLSRDGIHPTAEGYAIMEETLLPVLKKLH